MWKLMLLMKSFAETDSRVSHFLQDPKSRLVGQCLRNIRFSTDPLALVMMYSVV